MNDTQIRNLEQRVALLAAELTAVRHDLRALRVERDFHRAPAAPSPGPPPSAPPPAAPRGSLTGHIPVKEPGAVPARPTVSLEDLVAGRVMAWVGGSALLVGLILFLALAVSRGWIGEEARTAMAALASLLLVGGGARAYERRGRTEAAVAATAAGVAGGFATLAVATEVYALIPAAAGLPLGLVWGALAAGLALRWRSRTIAVLGIAGGLLSPVVAGADLEAAITVALLASAYAGAVAVCVTLGWSWLGLLAFALVTPQWASEGLENGALPAVAAFGLLGALAATGFALRSRAARFGAASHLLLALNAAVTAAAGYAVLRDSGSSSHTPDAWLLLVALAHVAGGLAARRDERISRTLGIAAVGLGIVLADIAFAAFASGLILPLAWAASAAGFALLARHEAVAALGLGGHLALAIGHVLTQEAPYADLGGAGSAAGLGGAGAIAAACLVSGRLLGTRAGRALDVIGLVALAYTTALAFEGAWLAAAWAAEAAALGAVARVRERDALAAAWAFLAAAGAVALTAAAPPQALALGLPDVGAAALALLAIAAAAPAVSRAEKGFLASGPALLYLASVVLVTWVEGQPGQLALSALWALVGLGALLAGVLRDGAGLRAAALGLLAIAAGKVFVVDLASLDSMARVGSFLVLGTLLLAGAFAWQRARPDPGPRTPVESAP